MFYLDFIFVTACIVGLLVIATYRTSIYVWTLLLFCYGVISIISADTFLHKFIFIISVTGITIFILLAIPSVSRYLITRPFLRKIQTQKSHISSLEKQALSAGNSGFEAGFFVGKPDWNLLRKLQPINLTEAESDFINGPINDFCDLTNDWEIRQTKHVPEEIWDFAKSHSFSGLRVKKDWGGKEFSFQAQSLILNKVASHSVDTSILIELPTSLYPDEIINEYGTEKQKSYYLTRLAQGEEVVSFAVTGIQGSDVGGMEDIGVVSYGLFEDKRVLGIRLNFNKRYITLAPKASLFVLAFKLTDPENLLQDGAKLGITLALIPAKHPGVKAEDRHFPNGLAFPHGPVEGADVFIPLDWVIGGEDGVGLGWKMIMQCLFVGRCLAIPSISVGSIKTAFLSTTAYAQVRRQFGLPIITFEGVRESVAKLAEITYVAESARCVAASLVDSGYRSLAVSALMKYRITEYARQAVNHALDVHGGRGICDGPSNYLLSAYNAVPIGVTVEGANIVSRSVITFAQGILQSHPYLRHEIESAQTGNIFEFEKALYGHFRLLFANGSRSLLHSITFGYFTHAPKDVPWHIKRWYQKLSRYASSFAFLSDITALSMGAQLKKKQRLGGRLADILSELYLLSSVLKRYEDDGFPPEDYPLVALCMKNGLYRIEESFIDVNKNYPNIFTRILLKTLIFPIGSWRRTTEDKLEEEVLLTVSHPGKTRVRLANHMFISENPENPIARLEIALRDAVAAEPVYKKMRAAIRSGQLQKTADQIDALQLNLISKEEAEIISIAKKSAAKAIAADSFTQSVYSK